MPSLPDSGLSIRELDALFDQSPITLVFLDRELRHKRTNAAFRRLTGRPPPAGRRRPAARPHHRRAGPLISPQGGGMCLAERATTASAQRVAGGSRSVRS